MRPFAPKLGIGVPVAASEGVDEVQDANEERAYFQVPPVG